MLPTEVHDFGRELRRLRRQRGMTQRALADQMAYHHSRVSQVESGDLPREDFARAADRLLAADGRLWALYQDLAAAQTLGTPAPERDLVCAEFVAWLADRTTLDFAALYRSVNDAVRRLETEPPSVRYGRDRQRRSVRRSQLVDTLTAHYGTDEHLYRAKVGDSAFLTSLATRPGWVGCAVDLRGPGEEFHFVPPGEPSLELLDSNILTAAVARIASAEVDGTVMINNPLYQLLDVDLAAGKLAAMVTTVDFARHAMTTELMEGELLDAAAAGGGRLPLREEFLPTIASAFDLRSRACVGGLAATLAIARRTGYEGRRDYVVLTQERSRSVLNATGKLAIIPKAFHQPTGEAAREAPVSATLRREFEEELLGREDLEQLHRGGHPHVDLLHEQHLTEPMAWLLDQDPGSYRVECTGVGFNLVTGNYEFACLVVVHDDAWWERFGHLVELNWEAERVHLHSTLDTAGLEALTRDPRWGNESLFSLLEGLRRLDQVGDPDRLALPVIEPEF